METVTPNGRGVAKKRGRKPQEKMYSLVNPQNNTANISGTPKDSLLVCLKVNRKLFDQLFKAPKSRDTTTTVSSRKTGISIEAYSKVLQEGNFMYSALSLPTLYPEIRVELEKKRAAFKEYHQIDLDTINHHLNQQNSYKRVSLILPTFTNGWPEVSNYACWNCTEKFDSSPVGLPTIHENRRTVEYRLEGNFCSYPCAARYLFDRENDTVLYQRYDLLNLLYTQVTDSKFPQVVPVAPPVLALKKFGGRLSIEEYHDSEVCKRDYKVYRHPLKPCPYFLEETLPIKSGKPTSFVPLNNTKSAEQRYKLYRKKPLMSKSHNIEDCMNIQVRNK